MSIERERRIEFDHYNVAQGGWREAFYVGNNVLNLRINKSADFLQIVVEFELENCMIQHGIIFAVESFSKNKSVISVQHQNYIMGI